MCSIQCLKSNAQINTPCAKLNVSCPSVYCNIFKVWWRNEIKEKKVETKFKPFCLQLLINQYSKRTISCSFFDQNSHVVESGDSHKYFCTLEQLGRISVMWTFLSVCVWPVFWKFFNIENGFGIIHAAMFYSRCYFAFLLLILDSKFRPRGDF